MYINFVVGVVVVALTFEYCDDKQTSIKIGQNVKSKCVSLCRVAICVQWRRRDMGGQRSGRSFCLPPLFFSPADLMFS